MRRLFVFVVGGIVVAIAARLTVAAFAAVNPVQVTQPTPEPPKSHSCTTISNEEESCVVVLAQDPALFHATRDDMHRGMIETMCDNLGKRPDAAYQKANLLVHVRVYAADNTLYDSYDFTPGTCQ